jgi:hypothetical protein
MDKIFTSGFLRVRISSIFSGKIFIIFRVSLQSREEIPDDAKGIIFLVI